MTMPVFSDDDATPPVPEDGLPVTPTETCKKIPAVKLETMSEVLPQERTLRITVAINPRAAFGGSRTATSGQIGEMAVERLRAAGHLVTVLRRRNYAELRHAVDAEIAAGAQALVVVGGDGMVHLGVNALVGSNVPLGIVPAGTGNDAARGLGLDPKDPTAAVARFLHACQNKPRTVDLGRISTTGTKPVWFMCALSAGFDALVNERANSWHRPRGPMRYNLAILRELLALKPRKYALLVDGLPRELSALMISVANAPSIGGGLQIVPDAQNDDGLLDLFVLSPVSRWTFLRILPSVRAGRHTSHPAVRIERVRQVRVDTISLSAYADGERVGMLPLTVDVEPGALQVWG
ncbi:diacylglycerol/lipid kinase family protein [Arthrobacter cryoconiti]|uniref:Diacylglycerol/lipid kinase family protein n=2 Tax=Arthrobacter cryoconiti TaxID=748907 RepID=A0ABV8QYK2_9MICC|nr:diacylglycerol kinase family protein [Arthrobacter cryoconiti]MCC9068416.1 diacylglycerol kinase [Arthrobacter cryoconiti]